MKQKALTLLLLPLLLVSCGEVKHQRVNFPGFLKNYPNPESCKIAQYVTADYSAVANSENWSSTTWDGKVDGVQVTGFDCGSGVDYDNVKVSQKYNIELNFNGDILNVNPGAFGEQFKPTQLTIQRFQAALAHVAAYPDSEAIEFFINPLEIVITNYIGKVADPAQGIPAYGLATKLDYVYNKNLWVVELTATSVFQVVEETNNLFASKTVVQKCTYVYNQYF